MAFASAGARVKAGSLHVSDSAVARVLNELNYLRSNHSDVMEAETDARGAFDSALKNHEKLKVQIDEKKAANDNYQKQVEDLLAQKLSLQANLSAAGEPQKQRKATSWLRIWKSTKNLFFFSLSLQRTLVWSARLDGLLTTHPAISIPQLNPVWRRTGTTAGPTALVATRTWLWLITQMSRCVWLKKQNLNGVNCHPSLFASLEICERHNREHVRWFPWRHVLARPERRSDRGPVGLGQWCHWSGEQVRVLPNYMHRFISCLFFYLFLMGWILLRYWMDGEPNNHGHRGEDCVTTAFSLTFPWKTRNDLNCQTQKKFWICEMAARKAAWNYYFFASETNSNTVDWLGPKTISQLHLTAICLGAAWMWWRCINNQMMISHQFYNKPSDC